METKKKKDIPKKNKVFGVLIGIGGIIGFELLPRIWNQFIELSAENQGGQFNTYRYKMDAISKYASAGRGEIDIIGNILFVLLGAIIIFYGVIPYIGGVIKMIKEKNWRGYAHIEDLEPLTGPVVTIIGVSIMALASYHVVKDIPIFIDALEFMVRGL